MRHRFAECKTFARPECCAMAPNCRVLTEALRPSELLPFSFHVSKKKKKKIEEQFVKNTSLALDFVSKKNMSNFRSIVQGLVV
jgi:hypothetical protein